ncbi:hypothetical protein EIP91_008780 [Steccherinum ochraceum]|uniref:Uncharacterized protein n=1 Tax=Steccherinum ochraceum TaxID=92696 RepID=A0A4R0R2E0_9APHY|nr:hypothetical protein EIP91_008780 [Steccherinum ochraceum]
MNFIGNSLGCFAAGMYFVLAFITIRFLCRHRRGTRAQKIILAYAITMLIVSMIWFSCAMCLDEIQTVENGMGGLGRFDQSILQMIIYVTFVVNIWLADSLFIYRLFIIWNRSLLVVFIPLLLWLGSVGIGIAVLISLASSYAFLADFIDKLQIVFFSLSVSMTVIVTLFIAGKLWYHERMMRKFCPSTVISLSLVAIIVESAALYSIAGLAFIPMVAMKMDFQIAMLPVIGWLSVRTHLTSYVFMVSSESPRHRVISPTLIVLRIALGTAATATTIEMPTFVASEDASLGVLHPQPLVTSGGLGTSVFLSTTSIQSSVGSKPPGEWHDQESCTSSTFQMSAISVDV